jgi:tetraacyldisaccharide 4'-kinase
MPGEALRHWLIGRWYGTSPPLALRPLAALYGATVRVRRALYRRGVLRSRHPGAPVIVVGNLTVGGTGKTPLVIWLARQLRAAGLNPGVALRGYGGNARAPRIVDAAADPAVVGDEAVLIAQAAAVPVAVGADRVAAATLLVRAGCSLVLADDGLQHLALRRDLAIVVVDGERGFGNGALLPAGPLREPAQGLAAADLVIVHGIDTRGVAPAGALRMQLQPAALHSLAGEEVQSLETLRGATVHAVAGIGNPARFFGLLRALGAIPIEHAFADHHRYRARDLDFGDAHRIVMTQKDAVKCAPLATPRMWCLPVTTLLPEPDATRLLQAVLAAARGDVHA